MDVRTSYILAVNPVPSRRLSIKVLPGGLLSVNAPIGISRRKIEQFISSRSEWISKRKNEYEKLYDFAPMTKIAEGLSISVKTGELLKIYQTNPKEIEIIKPKTVTNWQAYVSARPLIKQQLNMLAAEFLPVRTGNLAKRYGFKYQKLSIRYLRSRWGSCTSAGNISLNSQLMRLSNELIDYVISHELAHLTAPNHSAQFHKNLEKLLPNALSKQRQLKNVRLFY